MIELCPDHQMPLPCATCANMERMLEDMAETDSPRQSEGMLSFNHCGDAGDLIVALAVIKAMGGGTLWLSAGPGTREPMTEAKARWLFPLLKAQSYIASVGFIYAEATGPKCSVDFSRFRETYDPASGLSLGETQRRFVKAPEVDWSQPWIEVPENEKTHHLSVVLARSPRYHNPAWKEVWPRVLQSRHVVELGTFFVGHEDENQDFLNEFRCGPLASNRIPATDALDLAVMIKGASVFVGNQSLPFNLAAAMGVRRVLEVCPEAPSDCIYPTGRYQHILDPAHPHSQNFDLFQE